MKRLGILFVAMMMVSSVAMAQKGKVKKETLTPEQRATRQTEVMTKQLALTAEQQTKIKQVIVDKIIALDKVKDKYQGNKSKERNDEIREIRNSYMQSLKDILTPEQYGKWHERNKAKREKIKKEKNTPKGGTEEESEDIF